jgi:transglutaminase-like putative cysteine protease
MLYDIRLAMVSTYETAAPLARHVLRVGLRDWPGQRLVAQELRIDPEPADNVLGADFFGNVTHWITIPNQHRIMLVKLSARVERNAAPLPEARFTPAWEEVSARAAAARDLSPHAPAHFLFQSRLVALSDEIGAYAAASFAPGRPVLEGALDLMRRMHADFAYDAEATHVTTLPAEAFALRRGVCQDFAHVMIAGLRTLGLPARYVSGFLRTIAPPGAARLEGADATHAWVQIWCGPDFGWQGLDPTNALAEADAHILIGVGRDYADVAPLDGVIVTHGAQALDVAVDVTPVAAA